MARGLLVAAFVAALAVGAPPALARGATPTRGGVGIAGAGDMQMLSAGDRDRYLRGVRGVGARWIRVGIYWSVIQRDGPTRYNWKPFDTVVRSARRHGLSILGTIIYTPAWARPAGTPTTAPPRDMADYARFAGRVARHFRRRGVHAYEIWNEPNIADFWTPAPDPARYTEMLQRAYPSIKREDRSATVVSGGLSPFAGYGVSDAAHINPLTFLEQMYARGAGHAMDAVGWHPYNFQGGLTFHPWSAWSQLVQTAPSARSIMRANGDARKLIWATEWGAPTGDADRSVTEAQQAALVAASLQKFRTWRWAGPSFLFSFRDRGTNRGDIEDNFGLVRRDWSAKPSYDAFRRIATARR